jgi:hypothetical protein
MYRSHAGDMSPVSLVACHRQMLSPAPSASRLARERDWVQPRGSVSRRAMDYVDNPFSREQWPYSTLLMTRQMFPRTGTTHKKRTPCVRGLTWEAYMSC